MVRQNIGLKVSLIIFVFLTVVLSVVSWLYYDKLRETEQTAVAARASEAEARKETAEAKDEYREVLELLGFPEGMTHDQFRETYQKDMESYAMALFPTAPDQTAAAAELQRAFDAQGVTMNYYNTFPHLMNTVKEKVNELKQSQSELALAKSRFKGRVDSATNAVAQVKKQVGVLSANVEQMRGKYDTASRTFSGQLASAQQTLEKVQRDGRQKIGILEDKLGKTQEDLMDKAAELVKVHDQQRVQKRASFESPDGQITNVSADGSYVWIDLGSADGLRPGISFSVYGSDTANMNLASAGKGTIEITKVEDAHRALGRVKENSFTDPILRGDIIHTPLWSRGEVRKFAITGFIDIDGDGASDLDKLRRLIAMNQGEVVAYLDEAGERQGKMNYETRYLVLGEAPDHRSRDAFRENYVRMVDQAKELGIQSKTLGDVLREMGYRHETRVVTYGRGGNAGSVPMTSRGDGVPRTSTGSTAYDRFQNRRPPQPVGSGGGGAY